MSDSDSFIEEVNDEVRRDRLFAVMRRYGWIAIVLILALVGWAAWTEYSNSKRESAAQAFGDAVLSALDEKDEAARVKALQAIPATSGDQKALLALLAASEASQGAKDDATAVKILDGVKGDGADPIFAQLAEFKKLLLQSDTLSAEERRNAFSQLAAPGSAIYLLAQEQIALTYVEQGNKAKAIDTLKGITGDANVTPDLRQRASQLIVSLGGSVDEKAS